MNSHNSKFENNLSEVFVLGCLAVVMGVYRTTRLILCGSYRWQKSSPKQAVLFVSLLDPADLVVIGSGPGGYIAAIKAAQLGLKVRSLTVEKLYT